MTPSPIARLTAALDRRLGHGARRPSLWSVSAGALIGHTAVISFGLLVATGLLLTFTYTPSTEVVVYRGSSELYDGQELPAAFAAVVHTSEDVRGGLLLRRLHVAASYLFMAAIIVHMWRILATGAARRPRSLNHLVGMAMLLVALGLAFTGELLPFGIVAGASLRIGHAAMSSLPLVGEPLAILAFGAEAPTGLVVERSFWLHVLVLPVVFAGLLVAHLWSVHRRTQTNDPAQRDASVVSGVPLWPDLLRRLLVLGCGLTALLAVSAALIPWSDLALEGPFRPAEASNTLHPPWALFFLSGGLRIFPPVDVTLLGLHISGVLIAGVVLPGALLGALIAYPFVERRVVGDGEHYHVRQGLLEVPFRAGTLAALFTAFLILSLAAAVDVIAFTLAVPVEVVVWTFRIAILAAPPLAAWGAVAASHRRRGQRDPVTERDLERHGPDGV